jgi:hypothetical protein
MSPPVTPASLGANFWSIGVATAAEGIGFCGWRAAATNHFTGNLHRHIMDNDMGQ